MKSTIKEIKNENGSIYINSKAAIEIAGLAALESYGIIGMADPGLKSGIARILSRDKLSKGIKMTAGENGDPDINLFVVIESGINIVEVARNPVERVKYELKKQIDLDVGKVNVYVQALRGK